MDDQSCRFCSNLNTHWHNPTTLEDSVEWIAVNIAQTNSDSIENSIRIYFLFNTFWFEIGDVNAWSIGLSCIWICCYRGLISKVYQTFVHHIILSFLGSEWRLKNTDSSSRRPSWPRIFIEGNDFFIVKDIVNKSACTSWSSLWCGHPSWLCSWSNCCWAQCYDLLWIHIHWIILQIKSRSSLVSKSDLTHSQKVLRAS